MKYAMIILLVLCFATSGCDKEVKEKAELLELFQMEKKVNCRLASMKDSIKIEWDVTNKLLEDNLPPNIPEEEKTNMLKVRNANLIRMFKTYDKLDIAVKTAVSDTEVKDQNMTLRINALKQEAQKIEAQKLHLMKEVNRSLGSESLEKLKKINQSVLSEDCS